MEHWATTLFSAVRSPAFSSRNLRRRMRYARLLHRDYYRFDFCCRDLVARLCNCKIPAHLHARRLRAAPGLGRQPGGVGLDRHSRPNRGSSISGFARVIHSVEDAPKPPRAVLVTAVGHQFWREHRYPALGVVTTNELHVPVSGFLASYSNLI